PGPAAGPPDGSIGGTPGGPLPSPLTFSRTSSTSAPFGTDELIRTAGCPSGLPGVELAEIGTFRLRGFDDWERLFQVVAPGLERSFPRPRTLGAPVHNLPAAVT